MFVGVITKRRNTSVVIRRTNVKTVSVLVVTISTTTVNSFHHRYIRSRCITKLFYCLQRCCTTNNQSIHGNLTKSPAGLQCLHLLSVKEMVGGQRVPVGDQRVPVRDQKVDDQRVDDQRVGYQMVGDGDHQVGVGGDEVACRCGPPGPMCGHRGQRVGGGAVFLCGLLGPRCGHHGGGEVACRCGPPGPGCGLQACAMVEMVGDVVDLSLTAVLCHDHHAVHRRNHQNDHEVEPERYPRDSRRLRRQSRSPLPFSSVTNSRMTLYHVVTDVHVYRLLCMFLYVSTVK